MRGRGFFERLRRDVRGTSAVEYGLILGLIVLAIFYALSGVAGETLKMWTMVEQKSTKAHNGA